MDYCLKIEDISAEVHDGTIVAFALHCILHEGADLIDNLPWVGAILEL